MVVIGVTKWKSADNLVYKPYHRNFSSPPFPLHTTNQNLICLSWESQAEEEVHHYSISKNISADTNEIVLYICAERTEDTSHDSLPGNRGETNTESLHRSMWDSPNTKRLTTVLSTLWFCEYLKPGNLWSSQKPKFLNPFSNLILLQWHTETFQLLLYDHPS